MEESQRTWKIIGMANNMVSSLKIRCSETSSNSEILKTTTTPTPPTKRRLREK